MAKMQAAVLRAFKQDLSFEQVEIPRISNDEVLVRVMAAGICSTDLDIQDGKIDTVKLPHIPGHEIAGIVEECGDNAINYKKGMRVLSSIDIGCGSCRFCILGKKNLCLSLRRIGFENNGGYAQYVAIPHSNLVPFSESISFEKAALIPDSVACMYHAIKGRGNVRGGDRVLIMGVGGLGLQGVQIAHYFGAEVFATSRNDEKLKIAQNLGADHVVNTGVEDLSQVIMDATNGEGCDVVFDNIGTQSSVQEALNCVRYGGKVVTVGNASKTFTVDFLSVMFYEREIIGIRASNRTDLIESIRLVEKGHIDPYLFSVKPLSEVNKALKDLRSNLNFGRTVLVPEH